ncbi:MAG TPA: glycosyltransferase family 4 protein [Bdellovibrionota bacterium]
MNRVLHLTLYLDIGGLERMILVLCRGEKALGWKPYVLVYERDTGDLLPHFQQESIPVKFCRKGRGFSFRLLFRILAHLRENDITLIHSHDLGALIYGSLVKLLSFGRIKVVHTQHSFQHLGSRKMRLYERIFPWLAERLVCVSEDLRRTYLSLGQPVDHLRLVPNGVDFDLPRPSAKDKLAAKQVLMASHNFPSALAEKKWVITLGRIARVKGPHNALAVWNLVNEASARGAAMLIVGPESESGLVKKLKGNAKKEVYFPGPTLDSYLWLMAADLFLSGSEFEGLPMSGLEASAVRLPLLLSNIPGHALFAGLAAYFPLNEPAVGARLLEGFLESGRLGQLTGAAEARAKLEASCGARQMTERYIKIYDDVLRESRA